MGIETKHKQKSINDWHIVITEKTNNWPATQWCIEQFGKRWDVIDNRDGVWCCFWAGREQFGSYRWYFENECDAMWFTMRWA